MIDMEKRKLSLVLKITNDNVSMPRGETENTGKTQTLYTNVGKTSLTPHIPVCKFIIFLLESPSKIYQISKKIFYLVQWFLR